MSGLLLECFDRHARERPHDAALVVDDTVHTWGELHDASRRTCDELSRDHPPGGLVAVIGPSGPGAWIEVTAALRAGRSVMLVAPRLPERALASIASAFRPDRVRSSGGSEGDAEAKRLEALVTTANASADDARGPRLLLFSSGTTGRPRAIVRGTEALDRVAETLHRLIDFGPRERVLSFLPMHHAYGLEHALLAPILGGAAVEHHSTAPMNAGELFALVGSGRPTILPATPILLEVLSEAEGSAGRLPRRIYSAGSPLPERVADRLRERFGLRVDDLYGASELGTITLSDERGAMPVPGVALRIVDPDVADRLVDLPDGTSGEIAVRSDAMFEGYVDARGEPPRRERMIDGFFRTGDLGVLGPRGLRLVGRLKLQYDIGGLKVNAEEVERVLEEAPGVAHAVVVPIAVTETLRRLRAFIEPKSGASFDPAALAALAREKLAPHEVPRDFELVPQLPRTPSGKILRGALMERADAAR